MKCEQITRSRSIIVPTPIREERFVVRVRGVVAEILDELVRRGYFNTKSEAVREGIKLLGEKYGILKKFD